MIDWLHWLIALHALIVASLVLLLWLRHSLSDHIRRIRYEQGWTQAQFGERLVWTNAPSAAGNKGRTPVRPDLPTAYRQT